MLLIIEIILATYFIYFVSYSLFFAVGGLFYKKNHLAKEVSKFNRFAVLMPGYKEDTVILNSAAENLKVDYPKECFDLYVIADSFKDETLDELKKLPILVKEVEFEKSTKVKSLKKVIPTLPDKYDYIVILDADNTIETDYLLKVNTYLLSTNQKAVQTQRWPKNVNTEVAILDGISESINNHIYRQGAHSTGFSVSLSGSGMVFDRWTFENNITQMDSVGGFDRELEFRLLEQGIKVRYFKEAKVFDQKTDNHQNFENQRKRWVSSQYVYLFKFLRKGLSQLIRGNIVYFHSTVWRNIQLPRLINLGLLSILTVLFVFIQDFSTLPYQLWIALWCLNAFSMMISIPRSLYSMQLVYAVIKLPKLFLTMFLIMFKLKNANKKFIHTEHKAV